MCCLDCSILIICHIFKACTSSCKKTFGPTITLTHKHDAAPKKLLMEMSSSPSVDISHTAQLYEGLTDLSVFRYYLPILAYHRCINVSVRVLLYYPILKQFLSPGKNVWTSDLKWCNYASIT